MTGDELGPSSDFVEVTSADGKLISSWDKDADVSLVMLTTKSLHHGKLNPDKDKILEYDQEGYLVGVQLLYCSDGVSMNDIPQEAVPTVIAVLEQLCVTVSQHLPAD